MNLAAARLAREAADLVTERDPHKPRFVAGSLGPLNRTLSLSPDVNDPGYRNVTWDEVVKAYSDAARGLIEGGADIILIETIFDTLNAKGAIFAVKSLFEEMGFELPLMISGTITDASGRTLSGQTMEAFYYSIRHAEPLIVGLNCSLGPEALRPYITTISKLADSYVSIYPNAGLPNEFGEFDETPELMAPVLQEFAEEGLLNIVGGCCGTTPAHIKMFAQAVEGLPPRQVPEKRAFLSPERSWSRWLSRPILISSILANAPTSPDRAVLRASFVEEKYEEALTRGPPAGGEWGADDRYQHGRRHVGW